MSDHPLTKAQLGVYLECVKHPESTQYNNPFSMLLDPQLDPDRIEKAILNIYDVRKELHLHFTEDADGSPCQYISDSELKVMHTVMTEEEADTYLHGGFCRPFLLDGDEPLFRAEIVTTEENRYLLLDFHHLIADGTTMLSLFSHRDLKDAYEENKLKEVPYGLLDLAQDEISLYSGKAYDRDKTYYRDKFEGMNFVSLSNGSDKEGRLLFAYESVERSYLEEWCHDMNFSPNILFQAAFGYTLSVLSGEDRAAYLVENHGRSVKDLAESYGMFVNNTPVLLSVNREITVKEYLEQVRSEALLGMRHGHYPYMDLCSDMKMTGGARFNFLGMEPLEEAGFFGDVKCPITQLERGACFSDLDVNIFVFPDKYEIRGTVCECQNSQRFLSMFCSAMKNVTQKIMEDPERKLCNISLLSEEETDEVMSVSKGEELNFDENRTWVDLFCENALRNPEHIAVTDMNGSLSFGELDRASGIVAGYLAGRGIGYNDFVAVKMGRVKEFVVAVLGINKAGAAYIPIDPTYPEDRISFMIEDSEARLVLTGDLMAQILNEDDPGSSFKSRARADGLAYMIYTSGSTGMPKGAMILHRGLSAFCAWNNLELKQGQDTSHLIHSSFSFDASVFDMICPLAAGAHIHIADEDMRIDLQSLVEYIKENHITGMLVNTQIGMELIRNYDLDLRYLMLGGDRMLPVKSIKTCVYNAYGPTEFTAASSFYKVKGDEENVPIGRPVPGSTSVIIDRFGNLLPLGAAGELCLIGVQMGAGYYKQPLLTAEKFVTMCLPRIGEKTVYKTGDLARYNEEGNLEFLGRIDNQIKLRGYRIELEEIENVAAAYEDITDVAAVVKKDSIVLYFTADKQIDKDKYREYLSGKLTEFMMPSVIMQLNKIPIAPGGKIDKNALPEPKLIRGSVYEEPANETERVISSCIQKILGIEESIGRNDNFYELGGDSIMAIRLVSILRQQGVDVRASWILKSSSVKDLALLCTGSENSGVYMPKEKLSGPVGDSAIISFFKAQKFPKPMHFDQSILLKINGGLDSTILAEAITAIVRHHDILRAVWKEDNLVIESEDIKTDLLVYPESSKEDITRICEGLKESFEEGKPLFKAALIGGRYLFLTAHHTVVDGVSWRIIMDDLTDACSQLKEKKEVVLPQKTLSYMGYVKAQKDYAESYGILRDVPYWKDVKEKLFEKTPDIENDHSRSFGLWEERLDREATSRFLSTPFDMVNATAEDGLMTAVGRALYNVKGKADLSVRMEGHGREEFINGLILDETVGWFTSIYPVLLEGLSEDLLSVLLTVKETLHRVPGRGVSYGILQYLTDELSEKDPIPDISFNYLGVMETGVRDSLFDFEVEIDTGRDIAKENTFGPGLAINCMVAAGSFTLRLEYDRALYTEAEIREITGEIFGNLEKLESLLGQQVAKSVTASDLGENKWTNEEFQAVRRKYKSRNEDILRIYPLTSMQEGMLLKYMSEPLSTAYRLAYIYELNGVPTRQQAERVLERLAKKHEVLRTAIIYKNVSEPRQAILNRRLALTMRDIEGCDDPAKEILKIRQEVLEGDFDPEDKPLFRLVVVKRSETSSYLIMSVHHMIIDGWSLSILVSDISGLFREEFSGIHSDPDSEETSMDGIYEKAVRESFVPDKRRGLNYFRGLLKGYESPAEILSYEETAVDERSISNEAVLCIDRDTTGDLLDLCRQEKVTISNAVELAWARVLSVYSRQNDVVFAKTVSGRDKTEPDVTKVVGLFIRSIPVRVIFSADKDTRKMLGEIRQQAAESSEYDHCSLSEIQALTNLGSRLFQTVLTFENYDSGNSAAGVLGDHPIRHTRREAPMKTSTMWLLLPMWMKRGSLH